MRHFYLMVLLLINSIAFAQVAQFPQVYYNGQGAGGSNLNIKQSPSFSSSTITSLSINSRIGAIDFSTSTETNGKATWAKVCLPNATTGNITYGYMLYGEYYARIQQNNNYATVNTLNLNVRKGAGATSANVTFTSNGSAVTFSQGSIVALTGNSTPISGINWYELYLPNSCSQTTGWVNGSFLNLSAPQNYSIVAGTVENTTGVVIWGANVNIGPWNTNSTEGFYQYKVPVGWSGTIACTHPNYNTSTPALYNHTANNHNYNRNFLLSNSATSYTLSGTITNSSTGAAMSGVKVDATSLSSVTTNASGAYSFTVSSGYSGTITPSMSGFSFNPASRSVTNVTASQSGLNFQGTSVATYTLSGTITNSSTGAAMSGITVNATGLSSVTTNASGAYSFTVSSGYSGTITPSMSGFSFNPASRSVTNVTASQSGLNFQGTSVATYTLSGTITNSATGAAMSGVKVDATGLSFVNTNASGFYSFTVSSGYTGTITPSFAGFGFNPANRSFSNIVANQGNQNFSATANPNTYTISGTIKDVKVNPSTRTIDLINYAGCTVYAYNPNTSTVVGSDISSSNGYFEISLLKAGLYDIKVVDNSTPSNSVKMLNISTNSSVGNMKVPRTLLKQIENEKNHLIKLRPTLSSLGTSTVLSFNYNVAQQTAILNDWKNIDANHNQIIESAGRLFIADSVLQMFYHNADMLNDEMAISIYKLLEIACAFEVLKNRLIFNKYSLRIDAVEAAMDLIFNKVYKGLDQALNLSAPANYALGVSIKAGIDKLRRLKQPSLALYLSALEPVIQNIFASVHLNNNYIQKTQINLDYANNKAKNLAYTGTFEDNFKEAMLQSVYARRDAELSQIQSQYHREVSDIISSASDLLTFVAGVTTLTPAAAMAQFLRGFALLGKFWAAGKLGMSLYKAHNGFERNKEKLPPTIYSTYRKANKTSANLRKFDLSTLETSVNKHNQSLINLKSFLLNGDETSAANYLDTINISSDGLENSIKEALIPINASLPYAYSTIANYDSLFFGNFEYTFNIHPKADSRFTLAYLSFLLDNTPSVTKDSLLKFIEYLIFANNNIRREFINSYELIKGIASMNFIQNLQSTIPLAIERGTTRVCKVRFKNIGPGNCSNLYAKILFEDPFISNIDSVYIGNLAMGKEDSLTFYLSAPAGDTISNYNILFYAENTMSEGFIGAIKSRSIPLSPFLQFDSQLCVGDSLKLFANSVSSDVRFRWFGPNGFNSRLQNPIIPNATILNSGDYKCIIEDEGLRSVSATVSVTIKPIVVPSITQNPTNQTVIFPNGTNFSVTASGSPSQYQWQVSINGGNTWSDITNTGTNPTYANWTSTTLNISGTALSNNNYQYRCIVRGGSCIDTTVISAPAVLTVKAPCPGQLAPTATAPSNRTATGFTANWSNVSGASGYYLDVSTSSTFSGFVTGYNNLSIGNVLSRIVTGLACATTYYYRVRAVNNCGSISGNSQIIQTITTPCCGSLPAPTVTFGATSCPGTPGYSSYPPGTPLTWNRVPDATSYFVYVSKYPHGTANLLPFYNPFDCNSVRVSPLQSSVVLSAVLEPGMLYEWKMSATTDCNNIACAGPLSESRYFYVPPVITASATEVCNGKSVTLTTSNLTVKAPGTISYQWYRNSIAIAGANSYTYKASAEGSYYVALAYSGSTACSSTTILSNPISVKIKPIGTSGCLPAVANISDLEEFWIFPNPNTGVFNVKMKFSSMKEVQFALINNIGQRVYQSPVYKLTGTVTKEIMAGILASGIYQLQTTINNEVTTEKVMILH